jgi:hypothetical protein
MASLRHKFERERERESIECALDGVSLAVHNVLPKELILPSFGNRPKKNEGIGQKDDVNHF